MKVLSKQNHVNFYNSNCTCLADNLVGEKRAYFSSDLVKRSVLKNIYKASKVFIYAKT